MTSIPNQSCHQQNLTRTQPATLIFDFLFIQFRYFSSDMCNKIFWRCHNEHFYPLHSRRCFIFRYFCNPIFDYQRNEFPRLESRSHRQFNCKGDKYKNIF